MPLRKSSFTPRSARYPCTMLAVRSRRSSGSAAGPLSRHWRRRGPGPGSSFRPRPRSWARSSPLIDEILKADLDAPRKQRHTITRTYHRLMDEHGIAEYIIPVVRAYVEERKPQIRVKAGRGPAKVFMPQTQCPGDEAEVDFGEVVVRLADTDVKYLLFCLRLSFSGKAVYRVSLSGGQEAFFEGHEHAFRVLGGVPAGKIR